MTLVELNPRLMRSADDVEHGRVLRPVATLAEADTLVFDCPCQAGHQLHIPINGAPRAWFVTGTGLDNITLDPSLSVMGGNGDKECWHGWIRNGEVVTC